MYNILGDVLGTNSTSGPLGFRMKFFFVTWYNLLRPGALTCPLVPGVRAVRQPWQCVGYVIFLGLLVRALRAPQIGFGELAPCAGVLAILTPFDFVTFQACRGEHYGYMLVCCVLAPWQHALTGCQLVQLALWFFAGTAKVGPWFVYVMCFMMPNSIVLRFTNAVGLLRYRHLFVNLPTDVNPKALVRALAKFGCYTELVLSLLCATLPVVGVPTTISFHIYILSMMPFAS